MNKKEIKNEMIKVANMLSDNAENRKISPHRYNLYELEQKLVTLYIQLEEKLKMTKTATLTIAVEYDPNTPEEEIKEKLSNCAQFLAEENMLSDEEDISKLDWSYEIQIE